jgi:hypothetical protein
MAYNINPTKSWEINTESRNGWYAQIVLKQYIDPAANKSRLDWEGFVKNGSASAGNYITTYGIKFYVNVTKGGTGSLLDGDYSNKEFWPEPTSLGPRKHSGSSSPTYYNKGSFTISHNTAGQAKIIFTLAAWLYGSTDDYKKTSGDQTIELVPNIQYTAPSAPTNFMVGLIGYPSESIIVPGITENTFSYSFSGSSPGLNNSVKEYEILPKIGSVNQSAITVTSSVGSFTLKNLERQRGKEITFSVRAIGEITGYNSNYVTSGNYLRVNRLPNTPTGSSRIFPSRATNMHLDMTAGSDPDGQSTSVVYSASVEGAYKDYNSDTYLDEGTYYFKTKDILGEYSSNYLSLTVSKNKKITVKNWTFNTVKGTSSQLATNYDYIVSFNFNTLELLNAENLSKIDITYLSQDIGTTSPLVWAESASISFSSISSLRNYTFNPRATIGSKKIYQIRITPYDTIEVGNSIDINVGGAKPTAIAPAPSLTGYSNNHGDVIGNNKNIFWNKARFIFDYDSTYTYSCSCGTVPLSIDKNLNDEQYFLDVTTPDNLAQGNYTFTLTLTPSYGGNTITKTQELTETKVISSLSIQTSSGTIKPFTSEDKDPFVVGFSKFYGDGEEVAALNSYSFDILSANNLYISFVVNGVDYQIKWNGELDTTSDNNLVRASFLYGDGSSLGIFSVLSSLIMAGKYTARIKVNLTNKFGRVFSFISQNSLIIDYNEPVKITFTLNEIKRNNKAIIYSTILREKDKLTFIPIITGYTSQTISYQIQISKSSNNNFNSWETYVTGTANWAATAAPTRNKPVQYSISKEKVIGEISDSKDCVFRIIVNDGYSSAQTSEKTGSIKRFRFVSPTYQLLSSVVDSGKLTLQYKVIDIGFDGSINQITKNSGSFLKLISNLSESGTETGNTKDIISSTDNDFYSKWEQFKSNDLIISKTGIEDNENAKFSSLSCSITIGSVTKTVNQRIRYFILQPTVAYRKNRLGINTTSIDNISDAVMVVRAPSEAVKYIYFLGATDSPTGNEWNSVPFIDLENRTINNLIINGGSW